MPMCCVMSCKRKSNTSSLRKDGITFHLFPKSHEIRRIWTKACNRKENWTPSRTSCICSRHFDPSQYQDLKNRRLLVKNAIPHLCLYDSELLAKTLEIQYTNEMRIQNLKTASQIIAPTIQIATLPTSQDQYKSSSDKIANVTDKSNKSAAVQSLRERILKDKTKFQVKKIKSLQSKVIYLQKKIGSLEDMLISLNKRSSVDDKEKSQISKFLKRKIANSAKKAKNYASSKTDDELSDDDSDCIDNSRQVSLDDETDKDTDQLQEDSSPGGCNEVTNGYCYICVECAGIELCDACEAAGLHGEHYVLRVPEGKPQEEIVSVLEKIREELFGIEEPVESFEIEIKEEPDPLGVVERVNINTCASTKNQAVYTESWTKTYKEATQIDSQTTTDIPNKRPRKETEEILNINDQNTSSHINKQSGVNVTNTENVFDGASEIKIEDDGFEEMSEVFVHKDMEQSSSNLMKIKPSLNNSDGYQHSFILPKEEFVEPNFTTIPTTREVTVTESWSAQSIIGPLESATTASETQLGLEAMALQNQLGLAIKAPQTQLRPATTVLQTQLGLETKAPQTQHRATGDTQLSSMRYFVAVSSTDISKNGDKLPDDK